MREKRGFTLIEMLVVIAVIALLAVILLPVFASARDRARTTACQSHMHQIALGYRMYLDDNDGRFPTWYYWNSANQKYTFWTDYLSPYIKSADILRDVASPWKPDPGELRLADYTMFSWGTGQDGWGPGGNGTEKSPHWQWATPRFTEAVCKRAADLVIFSDGYLSQFRTGWHFTRHRGGSNVVMLDSHSKWLPAGEVFDRVDKEGEFYFYHYCALDR